MHKLLATAAVLALVSMGALAQTPPAKDGPQNSAINSPDSTNRQVNAPVKGANSFTEGEAKSRIEKLGFANVSDLKKDDHGVWRGRAMKDGKTVDSYETTFGVRTLKYDPNAGFFLNGEHVKLNGVCNHHDLGALGAAVNYRALQRQLEILKEMGCNAIRTSHNPPAPELLDMCDQMGFLVMDETFDTWRGNKTPQVTYDPRRPLSAPAAHTDRPPRGRARDRSAWRAPRALDPPRRPRFAAPGRVPQLRRST